VPPDMSTRAPANPNPSPMTCRGRRRNSPRTAPATTISTATGRRSGSLQRPGCSGWPECGTRWSRTDRLRRQLQSPGKPACVGHRPGVDSEGSAAAACMSRWGTTGRSNRARTSQPTPNAIVRHSNAASRATRAPVQPRGPQGNCECTQACPGSRDKTAHRPGEI